MPELRRALDQAQTPDQRLGVLRALTSLDCTFAMGTLLPEFVRAHDLSNAAALLWTLPGIDPPELSAGAIAGLTCALHSDIAFMRITTCKILGNARAAAMTDELQYLSKNDPVPLVRAYAAEAQRAAMAKPTRGFFGQQVRPPSPQWPLIFQPITYEELAPAEADKAQTLYRAAQAVIDANTHAIHGSASKQ